MVERANHIIRDSKVPLYHQLYDLLRRKILGGEWRPGDMVPSESAIIAQYRISRATVRQAFDALVRDGLVYRQRGRGSFVAHPTIEQGIGRIITFTEDMRQRGFAPGTKILSAEVVPAPESIAKELGIGAGDETIRLERLRLADDEPMSLEESWLVDRICRGLLQLDYRSRSLRELLEVHFGLRWARAKQTIRAISASHPLADRLSVPVNSAVLYIERVSFSEEDVPVEFLRLHHRGDRYVLYGELRR